MLKYKLTNNKHKSDLVTFFEEACATLCDILNRRSSALFMHGPMEQGEDSYRLNPKALDPVRDVQTNGCCPL